MKSKKDKFDQAPNSRQEWLCKSCATAGNQVVLGIVEGDSLRVKHKDLYIEIFGEARVMINCPKCGQRQELKSTAYDLVIEYLKKLKEKGEPAPERPGPAAKD